jgi:hypothetical protein
MTIGLVRDPSDLAAHRIALCSLVLICLTWSLICLRVYVRVFLTRNFAIDDGLLIATGVREFES